MSHLKSLPMNCRNQTPIAAGWIKHDGPETTGGERNNAGKAPGNTNPSDMELFFAAFNPDCTLTIPYSVIRFCNQTTI